MFSVIIVKEDSCKQYDHKLRKIAQRQFESYKAHDDVFTVSLVHSTRKTDEVIEYWERSLEP